MRAAQAGDSLSRVRANVNRMEMSPMDWEANRRRGAASLSLFNRMGHIRGKRTEGEGSHER